MRLRNIIVAILLTALSTALSATANSTELHTEDADALRVRGEVLWGENECADCHEYAVEPGQVVVPLDSLPSRFNLAALAAFLAAPPGLMPIAKLSEPDRQALAHYLLTKYR